MVAQAAGQKRTQFIKQLLSRNPEINLKAAIEARRKAGNTCGISNLLFYKTKSEVVSGRSKRPSNGAGKSGAVTEQPTAASASSRKNMRHPREVTKPIFPAGNGVSFRSSATGRAGTMVVEHSGGALDELEAQMDRLIFRVMEIGGISEVEQALRCARRQLIRSHRD